MCRLSRVSSFPQYREEKPSSLSASYVSMSRVFKIKFKDTLRRLSFPEDKSVAGWKFSELETKVREMFVIPHNSRVLITYTDADNDIVTMGDDQDLVDAFIVQGLNPLRLEVKVLAGTQSVDQDTRETSKKKVAPPPITEFSVDGFLTGLFPQETAEAVRDILNRYPPCLFTTVPASVLPEALETFLSTLTRYQVTPFAGCQETSTALSFDHCKGVSASGQGNQYSEVECLHKGVQCDGCGVTPIKGPRYKSMKKHDFDLCSSCFTEIGNKTDYHRMDRPMIHKNHCHYPVGSRMGVGRQPMGFSPSRGFFSRCPYGKRHEHTSHSHPVDDIEAAESINGILDSQFVQDVTILDGTELAPGTKFTKIWRLRNVGTLAWPQQTQLLFIGGDKLGLDEVVNLKLLEGGLPSGNEIDVSLDLMAPLKTGRYVSHWCLIAPSGQRFGHRVWVLIQVVPTGGQMSQLQECSKNPCFEHNAPGQESVIAFENSSPMEVQLSPQQSTEELDIDGGVAVSSLSMPSIINKEDVEADEQQGEENSELGVFSIVEKPLMENATNGENVGECELLTAVPPHEEVLKAVSQVVSELQVDHVEGMASGKLMSVGTALAQKDMQILLQETALEKLESMGFVQGDLNIELLQRNDYNLQQTIDDIVTSSGWDHMLKDLQELGFEDMQTNRRLLFKNDGSIKRVVKELVEMEKQMCGGKGKEKAA